MSYIQSYLAQQRLKKIITPRHFTSPITDNLSLSPTTSNYNSYASPTYSVSSPINPLVYSSNENSQNAQSDILAEAITHILNEQG